MVRSFMLAVAALFALAAPAWALPDLVVSELRVTPANAEEGTEITIETAIRNVGDMPVTPPGPSMVSTSADLAVVPSAVTPIHAGTYVTGWGPTVAIPPGGTERYTVRIRVPAGASANAGYICADVDLANRVREASETNNRRCVNFHARAPKPNLVVSAVTVGPVSGLSRRVNITVRNTGAAPALNFRVDAYSVTPERWMLTLTTCAQTTRGGSASCPALWIERLEPGASRTLEGWVTFPADRPSGSRQAVDFMADGFFPRLEPGLPAYGRVDESNERDNQRRASLIAP